MYINEIDFEDFIKDVVINMPESDLLCESIEGVPHLTIKGRVICTHFKYEKFEYNFSRGVDDKEESLCSFIKYTRDLALERYYEYITKEKVLKSQISILNFIKILSNKYYN